MNTCVFVDGHTGYIPFYFDRTRGNPFPCFYNPPASYDYQWGED